jgi:hypothetical protein
MPFFVLQWICPRLFNTKFSSSCKKKSIILQLTSAIKNIFIIEKLKYITYQNYLKYIHNSNKNYTKTNRQQIIIYSIKDYYFFNSLT